MAGIRDRETLPGIMTYTLHQNDVLISFDEGKASIEDLPNDVMLKLFALLPALEATRCQRLSLRFFSFLRSNQDQVRKFSDQIEISFAMIGKIVLMPPLGVKPDRHRSVLIREPQKNDRILYPWCEQMNVVASKNRLEQDNIVITHEEAQSNYREAVAEILYKIAPFCSFDRVNLNSVFPEDCLRWLPLLPTVTAVKFTQCYLSEAGLLQMLRENDAIKTIHFNVTDGFRFSRFSREFLYTAKTQGLRGLVRDSMNCFIDLTADLTDDILRSMTSLRCVLLPNVHIRVTLSGLRKVVDDWRAGKRDLVHFALEFSKEDHTAQELLDEIHDCAGCMVSDHRIWNFKRTEARELEVLDKETSWMVRIMACGNHCECKLFEQ